VKILDFGLAKVQSKSAADDETVTVRTKAGVVMGTAGYMSPEQVRGAASDHRSDIFSLGVILHEMISGAAPFHGDSAVETLHAILKDDPPPPPSREGVTPALEQVIKHCLEKSPDARFQSARDLAFVLELILRAPEPTYRLQPATVPLNAPPARPALRPASFLTSLTFDLPCPWTDPRSLADLPRPSTCPSEPS
jgi:serine/threonine protein kinase